MVIDIVGADTHTAQIITKAADATQSELGIDCKVSIAVVDEERIRQLNAHFRGIDAVTDVLSFPNLDNPTGVSGVFLGDIAICFSRAILQAMEFGHSLDRELAFLTVHGVLHLAGYDHIIKEDEEIMFEKQHQILTNYGFMR